MYEKYTRQALPEKGYRELLGSAICVFNSNNAFVIENILNSDSNGEFSWYKLIDKESGWLIADIKKTISLKANNDVAELFEELVSMRNRIIHSYQITTEDNRQMLCTKTRIKDGSLQFLITEEYLLDFIEKNGKLSDALYQFRNY